MKRTADKQDELGLGLLFVDVLAMDSVEDVESKNLQ